MWHHCHVHDIDELQQCLLHVRQGFEQSLIDDAVDQWPTTFFLHVFLPMNILYLVTVNLFSLYLINFMFHITLDAVGNILYYIVYCKSVKCDVIFSQGSVSTLFRWGKHVIHVCIKMFLLLTAVQKLQKSNEFFQSYDRKCTATFFMNHSVLLIIQQKLTNSQ